MSAASKLIIIADEERHPAFSRLIGQWPVEIVDCRDVTALKRVSEAAILIDIDLRDPNKVKSIQENLPAWVQGQCRIVAVERGDHWSEIQANGLGASDLLKRPLSIRELRECLWRRFMCAQDGSDASLANDEQALRCEPGGPSIIVAADTLDGMFNALTSDQPLEVASVEGASEQIIDDLGEVGLTSWLDTVRRHHESTFQHCLIVTGVLGAFAKTTGMRRSDILTLTIAGMLHDIGKAQIPVEILDKPGKLSDEEFAIIKQHPIAGYEYLCGQDRLDPKVLRAVRHHHEYLDGSGYPDGLLASEIDDMTRVMTICDVYGALVERRAYKAPKSPEAAIHVLTTMAHDGKVQYEFVKALESCVLR